ncbi:MAG: hypothetical protein U0905_08850 [Pirellulales bacterium]
MADSPPKVKPTLGTFLLGFVACVVVPGLVTAIAPVSYLTMERTQEEGGSIRAEARQCMFFIVPFRTQKLDSIAEVNDHVIAARSKTAEERRRTRTGRGTIEGEGTLILVDDDERAIHIPVSPASIATVKKKVDGFIHDPNQPKLSLFLVANWKFSLIGGGLVTLLTILFVVGWSIQLVVGFFKMVTRGTA